MLAASIPGPWLRFAALASPAIAASHAGVRLDALVAVSSCPLSLTAVQMAFPLQFADAHGALTEETPAAFSAITLSLAARTRRQ